jgi:hypothetical protein
MGAPHDLSPARPLTASRLEERLRRPLSLAEDGSAAGPSLAQSLTRLQFLRESLFRGEDWEELAWLIAEGAHFERKRLRKHPLFKRGPRRRLQERVQHFHGRAAVKAVALIDALEVPLRRQATRRAPDQPPGQAPFLPWRRFVTTPAERFGAPSVEESAGLLAEAAPLARHLIALAGADDPASGRLLETWEHYHWHACEVGAVLAQPTPWWRKRARQDGLNRLLLISLEHAHALLLGLRDTFLHTASGLSAAGSDFLSDR